MSAGSKILVVDDSPVTLEVVGRILSQSGHSVETVLDVAAAVSRLDGSHLDLVITDFRMPGADGMTILAAARADDPALPVILITGFGTISSAVEAMQEGAYLGNHLFQMEIIIFSA